MVVHEYLWVPAAERQRHLPRFGLAHGQRVAVQVHLIVVGAAADPPRLLALLLDRPRVGVAAPKRVDPGDEALVAVRVVRQVHHHHAALEDGARGRVLPRRQLVGHLHHGLERRRFIPVDAVVEPHRGRRVLDEPLRLGRAREPPRVGELRRRLADGVEPALVLGRGDDEQRPLAELVGASERLAHDAVGRGVDERVDGALHVAVRAVERAGVVAQHLGRLRDPGAIGTAVVELEAGGGGEGRGRRECEDGDGDSGHQRGTAHGRVSRDRGQSRRESGGQSSRCGGGAPSARSRRCLSLAAEILRAPSSSAVRTGAA